MQRKLFIGIDLPEQIKKRLINTTKKWHALPVKWSRPDNLHVTLSFIGYVNDTQIPDICISIGNACKNIGAFDINLEKIISGPEDDKRAKMFWLTGEPSEELKKLKESIDKEVGIFQKGNKVFRPHITLGRIRKTKWEQLSSIPKIDESFSVSIPIDGVQVFESAIVEGKRKFIIIEDCPLSSQ